MSQLYRQMEESVAQKVRETMELANVRRKAFASKEDNQTADATQNLRRKPSEVRGQDLEHSDGSIDSSVRIIEGISTELTESEDDVAIGKAATAKQRFLATDTRNVADDESTDLTEEGNSLQFHIGFEHIRENVDKKHIRSVEHTTELPSAPYLSDDNRELALGALTLAQTAAQDIDNLPYVVDKRQLAEGALSLAQNAAWDIDNRPHQSDDTNQRHLAMGALSLAQDAAWNVADKVYEEADNRQLAEAALILAQSAAWNVDNEVYDGDEADRQLPEGDGGQLDKSISNKPEGELNLALAEGALNLAKKAAWDIDNRLEADVDRRRFAEGALGLAQNAVWNVDKVYDAEGDRGGEAEGDAVQTNINRRELAEGALNMAQRAAKNVSQRAESLGTDRRLSREAGSLEGGSFENVIDPYQRDQKLQLGFDHFAAFHNEIRSDPELGAVLDDINKRSLAEHDKKTVSAAETKIRQLSEDLQHLEMDIDNNNYDETHVDDSKRELAESALGLAQMGARYISEEVYETSDGKIRELGEGALSLAQTAAKEQLSKETAGRSSDDAFYKSRIVEHKQTFQLGFQQMEKSSDSK